MIPGYRGSLVSEFFLEQRLDERRSEMDGVATQPALARWARSVQPLGPASSVRAVYESGAQPLFALLGIGDLSVGSVSEKAIVAFARARGGVLVIATVGWGEPLRDAHHAATAAAAGTGAAWSVLFNGTHVAFADAEHSYRRRHAVVDLRVAADSAATSRALWFLTCAATTGGHGRTDLHDLATASRDASVDVCRALRNGVLAASGLVTTALAASRAAPVEAAFDQALTVVYRVLFLLFAEARGLVPMWHPVYRASYSIDALRTAAARSAAPPGTWDALRAIGRLAHAGCRVGELRVQAFNGRLFAPARTPLVESRRLDDRAARDAIVALTTDGARRPIPYRDLGVEQLGSVYETLLDYEPRATRGGRGLRHVTLERGSLRRKSTGSFYTPQQIADFVVREALEPLVRDRAAEEILALRVVDPAMGSGAFIVSACRYLAGACEAALVRSGARRPSEFDDRERAILRRAVADRCLYGVDLNPTAVQLARLSLWLATLAADRPLTFLDHHLAAGNSLVGAWLSSLRGAPPYAGRYPASKRLPLLDDDTFRPLAAEALPVRFRLEEVPDDTVAQVRAKERALDSLLRPGTTLWRWKQLADAWCAPWFVPGSARALVAAYGSLADEASGATPSLSAAVRRPLASAVSSAALAHRFFHWELAFPEVFFSPSGTRRADAGFDAVIGNPPWEMVRADAGDSGVRESTRGTTRALLGFARGSGLYPSQRGGHANQYQLFLERAIALTKPGGRVGLVMPSGLAIDAGSAALRDRLLTECDVDRIVGFENQQAIFPIHRSVRFLLATATKGRPTLAIACRFGERDPAALDRVGQERAPVVLTTGLLARLSPRDRAIPDLQSPLDLQIAERAVTMHPMVGARSGWHAEFGRELNATDDRPLFHDRPTGLPVVEGKHLAPFRVDLAAVTTKIAVVDARRRLGGAIDRPRLCYRDVAGAGNRTTLIAALLPAATVSTHTVFCLRTPLDDASQWFLCALFNSLVVNYLVRLRVGTHVTTAIVEGLPIPTRDAAGPVFEEIVDIGRRLAARTDDRTRAQLDATVARLYQLSVEELDRVLTTFPLVAQAERRAVRDVYVRSLR